MFVVVSCFGVRRLPFLVDCCWLLFAAGCLICVVCCLVLACCLLFCVV